jgi:hypothetical protein
MAYLFSLNDLVAPVRRAEALWPRRRAASPVCHAKCTAGDDCATGEGRWHTFIR